MISKKVISNILSKCYLGNSIESVEWEIKEENLYINFMNGPETLVGYVEYRDSIGLKNGNYRIYNTSNLIKCINILDGDILLASDNDYLNIADTNYEIRFSLAESGIIKQAEPIDSNDYNWVASFSINDEFITRFVRSKDALGDLNTFTVETNAISAASGNVSLSISGQGKYKCETWTKTINYPTVSTIKATFIQVFEV